MVYQCMMLVICRFEFVVHKIALTHIELLICALHLPELNELSPVPARSAQQRTSRARPQLSSGPSLGISARFAKLDWQFVEKIWCYRKQVEARRVGIRILKQRTREEYSELESMII